MSAAARPCYPILVTKAIPQRRFRCWATSASAPVADIVALSSAGILAVVGRVLVNGSFAPSEYLPFIPTLAIFLVVFALSGLYPGIAANPIQEFRRILGSTSLAYLLIIGATFFTRESSSLSRLTCLFAWLFSLVFVLLCRTAMRSWCSRQSWWGVPVVILGSGSTALAMLDFIQRNPTIGLRPIALLDRGHVPPFPRTGESGHELFTGSLALAPDFARRYRTCYAIVAMPDLSSQDLSPLIAKYASGFRRVLIVPNLSGLSSLWVSAKELGGMLGLEVSQTLSHRVPLFTKRCFDVFLAALSLTAAPLLLLLYIAVRLSSPGPALYGQRRIGQHDRSFTAWKFRTMVINADQVLQAHLKADPALREEWLRDYKLKKDPRVTPLGRLLRKTSLDELPQIWNVLRGEMSVVGPRPIVAAEVPKYGKRFELYRKVTPGITGLWQISGRNNTSYDARTEFDEYYVRNWSVCLDLYILFRTVKTVLFTEGAY
jgi:Undecaprenyl-phosphate galactose phosphotransferase WbaP